jgi:hypothetical protein
MSASPTGTAFLAHRYDSRYDHTMASTRVTVTLPPDAVEEIDRLEANRSRFVLEAIRRELARRRREELRRSLREPHPEASALAEMGFTDWARSLPDEAAETLVDLRGGTAVQWTPGKGWTERKR